MKLRSIIVSFIITFFLVIKTYGIDTIPTFYRLLQQAKKEIVQDPQYATLLVDSMKSLVKPGDSNLALLAYELESEASFHRKDYLRAYHALVKIDSLLIIEGDQQRIAVNYNRLGLLFTEWGAFDKALDYLTKALSIRIKLAEPAPVMFTLNAISHLYLEMGSDSLALKTIREAISYSNQVRDSFNVSHVYFSAGKIFEKLGHLDSARHYYSRSLLYRDAVHHYSGIVEVYNGLARIALTKSDLDSTLFFLTKAIEFSSLVDQSPFVETNLLLIEAYQKQKQNHLALLTARKIQDKLSLIQNINAKRRAYRILSELYERQGDIKNALVFNKLAQQIQDSILSQYKIETNAKISTLLKVSQKESNGTTSRETLDATMLQKYFFPLLLFVSLISVSLAVYFYRIRLKIGAEKMHFMNQCKKLIKEIDAKEFDLLKLKAEIEQQRVNHWQQTQHFHQIYKSTASIARSIDEIMGTSQRIITRLLNENLSAQQQGVHYEKLFTLSLIARQRAQKMLLTFEPISLRPVKNQELSIEQIIQLLEKKIADDNQPNSKLKICLKHQNFPIKGTVNVDPELLSDLLECLLEISIQNAVDGELQFAFRLVDDEFFIILSDSRVLLAPEYQKLVTEWQQLSTNDFPTKDSDKYNPWLFKACRISKHLGLQLQFEHHAESGINFLLRIKSQNTPKSKESKTLPDWKGKHILIAEDEILNYEVLKSFIKPTGAKVSHANSGIEIVEFIKTMKFDLVIMDIKMPRMDGLDALQMLKKELPGIPVIACTAHANASERDNFIEMGFADLLLKPVCRESLYHSVGRFLQLTH